MNIDMGALLKKAEEVLSPLGIRVIGSSHGSGGYPFDEMMLTMECRVEEVYRPFNDEEMRELTGRVIDINGENALIGGTITVNDTERNVTERCVLLQGYKGYLTPAELLTLGVFHDTGERCGVKEFSR